MESTDDTTINWYVDILPSAARKALEVLSISNWLGDSAWYLAGGTALALQASHRSSVDLDFFLPEKEFDLQSVLKHFSESKWITDIARENTIYGRLLNAKVSFIAYPFFIPRQPYLRYGQIKVLQSQDIGVMKIVAISQRGTKRDFVDLYWLCQNIQPLQEFIKLLPDQYPSVSHDFHHIIKSLVYFDDAEKNPMPKLNFQADWRLIKKFFQEETKKIAREFIGID